MTRVIARTTPEAEGDSEAPSGHATYAPLYLAGPVAKFDDFAAASKTRPAAPTPKTLGYALRTALGLVFLEAALRRSYVFAIGASGAYDRDESRVALFLLVRRGRFLVETSSAARSRKNLARFDGPGCRSESRVRSARAP